MRFFPHKEWFGVLRSVRPSVSTIGVVAKLYSGSGSTDICSRLNHDIGEALIIEIDDSVHKIRKGSLYERCGEDGLL